MLAERTKLIKGSQTSGMRNRAKRLAEQGIAPEKPPYSIREGGSRLCFVRDPDGYRIEILERP